MWYLHKCSQRIVFPALMSHNRIKHYANSVHVLFSWPMKQWLLDSHWTSLYILMILNLCYRGIHLFMSPLLTETSKDWNSVGNLSPNPQGAWLDSRALGRSVKAENRFFEFFIHISYFCQEGSSLSNHDLLGRALRFKWCHTTIFRNVPELAERRKNRHWVVLALFVSIRKEAYGLISLCRDVFKIYQAYFCED